MRFLFEKKRTGKPFKMIQDEILRQVSTLGKCCYGNTKKYFFIKSPSKALIGKIFCNRNNFTNEIILKKTIKEKLIAKERDRSRYK